MPLQSLNSFFSRILHSTSPNLKSMSISTKLPHPLIHHSNPPSLKTLKFSSLPSNPTKLTFFRSITLERISTKSNLSAAAADSQSPSLSLQPIEELPPKLQEIVKLFQQVEQPKAKYEQLLFYGKNLKPLDAQYKTNENKVKGCVSQVWVRAYFDNSDNKNVIFEADSDSVLTKGLAALLVQGLSGSPVSEIVKVSPDFAVLLGLQQSLTPSRNNGFLNMLKLMQEKALLLLYAGKQEKDVSLGQNKSSGSWAPNVNGNGNVESVGEVNGNGNVESAGEVGNSDKQEKDVNVGRTESSAVANGNLGRNDVGVSKSRGMRIKERLEKELKPIEIQVEDISYQHAGHSGVRGTDGETHFNLKVVSKEFEGKSLVKRHRMIYTLLQDELQNGLHALSIVAKTPSEVSNS